MSDAAAGDHRADDRVRAAGPGPRDLRRAPASACWSRRWCRGPSRRTVQLFVTFAAIAAALVSDAAQLGRPATRRWPPSARSRSTARPTSSGRILLVFGGVSFLLFAERKLDGASPFAAAGRGRARHAGRAGGDRAEAEHTEVFPLALFALSGMMLFPASNDLITMFVALEILSLPLYLLCGLARRRRLLSQEAALKYFLLGALSSAFFLYGAALLYGYSGSFTLGEIDIALRNQPAEPGPAAGRDGAARGRAAVQVRRGAVPLLDPGRVHRCARPRSPPSWPPAPRSPRSAR